MKTFSQFNACNPTETEEAFYAGQVDGMRVKKGYAPNAIQNKLEELGLMDSYMKGRNSGIPVYLPSLN